MKNFNFLKKGVGNHFKIKNFSTLIVPQISGEKLHPSTFNLSKAAADLDDDVHLLLYGKVSDELVQQSKELKNIKKIIKYTNKELNLEDISAEHLSNLVARVNSKVIQYDNIITSSNNFGKNFLPMVGGLLNVQPISDVAKVEDRQNQIYSRYYYAGNALSKVQSQQKPNLMTIRLTSFDKVEGKNDAQVEVQDISENEEINGQLKGVKSSKFIENLIEKTDKVDLSQARVVISGGRALKSKENFKLLEGLASVFQGAAIGASRAAVDAGYVPNDMQIGQTGKVVAPDLYIAIGISGAIQHIAGMKDSKVIVAINQDADSPIFNIATYGLVGNLFDIIPELKEKISKLKP